MYNGILNVYKEKGFTSHDVVAVLRGVLGQKKIGHTGTLDPEATGVLPICLGKGTKVAGMLTDQSKVYRATMILGNETDTQDHTGEIIESKPWAHITTESVEEAVNEFVGEINQVPPMYSALKVNGKKLYDLAREGKVVERKSRQITIYSITDLEVDLPHIAITIHCSKGTYIRTLCRDIAEKLDTCGHMTSLERTATGGFSKDDALTLDQVKAYVAEGIIDDYIKTIDSLYDYEKASIKDEYFKLLDNGNKLPYEATTDNKNWLDQTFLNVYNEKGDYMGIYQCNQHKNEIVPIKFFNLKKS